MTPLTINTAQLQTLTPGQTLDVLIPIQPHPRNHHENDTVDGTWSWKDPNRLFDDLTIHDELKRNAPLQAGDRVYAHEPWLITLDADGSINVHYLNAPAETRNLPEPLPHEQAAAEYKNLQQQALTQLQEAGYRNQGNANRSDWRDSHNNPITELQHFTAMHRRSELTMPAWISRYHFRVTHVDAEPLTLLHPAATEPRPHEHPWVYRLTLAPHQATSSRLPA